MNLLTDNVGKVYFKYLSAAFGSAMISSIYGIVDMAMVGQYQGPDGTAALAVVAPVWNVIYSLGLLMGIGGSVIFSTQRGKSDGRKENENEYFTAALAGSVILAVLAWIFFCVYERPVLAFFGADSVLLPLAMDYVRPIKFVLPLFLFNQMLSAFLRNDGNPGLATAGVLSGGIFNVFGDYFFVFTLDMGIFGAGLATAIGAAVSFVVLLTHFFSRKNTLRLARPSALFTKLRRITVTGFSTFFIDIAMGILTIIFNRQIMRFLGSDALAVYGPIVNVSTIVQCCAYSVGQAAQPLISVNYGAKNGSRIRDCLKYSLYTVCFFSIFWTALSLLCPNLYVRIFMKPTENILAIAPAIIRVYGLSFILLPLNIFSTYYFQALMRPASSFIVSVSRCVVSAVLISVLPVFAAPSSIWTAMPVSELIVAVFVVVRIRSCTRRLGK